MNGTGDGGSYERGSGVGGKDGGRFLFLGLCFFVLISGCFSAAVSVDVPLFGRSSCLRHCLCVHQALSLFAWLFV